MFNSYVSLPEGFSVSLISWAHLSPRMNIEEMLPMAVGGPESHDLLRAEAWRKIYSLGSMDRFKRY